MQHTRALVAAAIAAALSLGSAPAKAEQRTWDFLTTGNGHGFQVYDASKKKITSFLEHPYRYIAPPPGDPKSDGIGRRNLAYDVYFGVHGGAGSGWLNAGNQTAEPSYVDQSNILLAPLSVGTQQTESYYFAPFGYEGNAMVALLHAPGASDGFMLLNFHMGNGRPDPDASGESLRALPAQNAVIETGPGGGAMVYVALSGSDHIDCVDVYNKVAGGNVLSDKADCAGNDVVPGIQKKLGADGWMAVGVQFVENAADADAAAAALNAWGNKRTGDKILADAKAEFEAWRKPPSDKVALCSDDEKKLWRQSEAVLRMGQVREPRTATRKNTGMILASLPPGEWHTGWVRDAMYAVVALARMGHWAESKAALDFFLNAEPVGKYASFVSNQTGYRISVVRYFGTGEEEADYSGQPSPNVEIDGWGMMMWAARQYVEASGDTAWLASKTTLGPTVYDSLLNGVAKPLEANLESNGIVKADSGIWEVHDQNKRHFAYTTLAAARGFCDMAAVAKKAAKPDDAHYRDVANKTRDAFLATFVDPQGALGGSLEGLSTGKYYDGAVAEAFGWNILPDFKNNTAKQTLTMLNNLRVPSGGYKRNNDGLSSYDNNEWILVDMRISNALRRSGDGKAADGIFATLVSKAAANFYLLPELYNAIPADGAIGKYTGSIPMVGYGGGAYVITVLDRSGLGEPNDCGDGKGQTLEALSCTGISTDPGNNNNNGGPGADGGIGANGAPDASQVPYVGACLCNTPGVSKGISWASVAFGLFASAAAWRRRRAR